MPLPLKVLGLALLIALGAFTVDRLAIWMDRRGWIHWRKAKPAEGIRRSLGVFQELVQPEIRYVEEEKRQHHALHDDESAGEGPGPREWRRGSSLPEEEGDGHQREADHQQNGRTGDEVGER